MHHPSSSGLRNRRRRGMNKRPYQKGDKYGLYLNGRIVGNEIVAGKTISDNLPTIARTESARKR